jgi:hypothetical protein
VALQAEQCAGCCGGDTVLAGARFRDDALLAHAPREKRLAERVVDLVRASVGQVLPLQEDPRSRCGQRRP